MFHVLRPSGWPVTGRKLLLSLAAVTPPPTQELAHPGCPLGRARGGSIKMISLRIQHRTTYRYRSPVAFGAHRLMLRPRENRELRLTAFELTTTPQASVRWAHDVWGNAVASANFQAMSDTVAIESLARIELDAVAWPVFDIAASAIVYRSAIPTTDGPTSGR
jgi:transglutaminase-like putative cysteine protease